MSKTSAKKLGRFVKEQREAKGLSLRELARQVKLEHTTLAKLERGGIEQPGPDRLVRIARALDCDVEDLYALAGYMMPEGLPEFAPYLRSKYGMTDKDVRELEQSFIEVRDRRAKGGGSAKPRN